jgi:threonine/homoserine/homoserine lactone efflux protein
MMTFETALSFFIAMLIFSITPGPGVFAIISRALVSGSKNCVGLTLGMIISDVMYLLLACFGLAAIAENWATLFNVIRYLGAAYLVYLGWRLINSTLNPQQLEIEDTSVRSPFFSGLIQGFLISASNPKVILFYISFLPSFMDLTSLSYADIVLVSVIASLALFIGVMGVAFGAARLSQLVKTPRAYRALNLGSGSIMIAAGSYLALNS